MNKAKEAQFQIGNLIAALYDEAAQITSNKTLQASIVYLALSDLRRLLKKDR
ncbi:hypothetical protein L0244_03775 [bacterium]|nr:hypothetical protein [bacterium]MCI0612088.1 hypothetical protein [bacterium]